MMIFLGLVLFCSANTYLIFYFISIIMSINAYFFQIIILQTILRKEIFANNLDFRNLMILALTVRLGIRRDNIC